MRTRHRRLSTTSSIVESIIHHWTPAPSATLTTRYSLPACPIATTGHVVVLTNPFVVRALMERNRRMICYYIGIFKLPIRRLLAAEHCIMT